MALNQNKQQYLNENIFVQLGLANASAETKQALLDQMNELIEKRMIARLIESSTDEQRAQINAAAESGSEEELFGTLISTNPKFSEMLQEEIERVRQEMKASMAQSA